MAFEGVKKEIMCLSTIQHHYLQVEAEAILGDYKTIWNWEIKIAIKQGDKKDYYYGMALEREYNVLIPWQELKDYDFMREIKDMCINESKFRADQVTKN